MSESVEKELADLNRQVDEVMASNPAFALTWLRGALLSTARAKAELLADYQELKELHLKGRGPGLLSVREAQLCDACRICRRPCSAPFVLNFGEEYAHQACLDGMKK